jgi:hypothetical protein
MAPPTVWGPPAWQFIFAVIDDMPEYPADTEPFRMFFESFRGVLPCRTCREHYAAYIVTRPPPVWSRTAMWRWASTLRNTIREHNQAARPS